MQAPSHMVGIWERAVHVDIYQHTVVKYEYCTSYMNAQDSQSNSWVTS
jgi:hypothetical protein